MTLYIDGDAFPNLLKLILTKQIERLGLETFVIPLAKPYHLQVCPYYRPYLPISSMLF